MARRDLEVKATEPPAISDALATQIADSMRGMYELRSHNEQLTKDVARLETANAMLESELASIKAVLEGEKAERRHYQSLATEIITRLDVVCGVVDDVVKKAQHEVFRLRRENTNIVALPELKIPGFLSKGPAEAETNGGHT